MLCTVAFLGTWHASRGTCEEGEMEKEGSGKSFKIHIFLQGRLTHSLFSFLVSYSRCFTCVMSECSILKIIKFSIKEWFKFAVIKILFLLYLTA